MQQKSTRMHVTQKQQTHQHLSPERSQSHYNWLISNGYHINPFSKQGLGTITLSPYYQETYFLFTAQVLLFTTFLEPTWRVASGPLLIVYIPEDGVEQLDMCHNQDLSFSEAVSMYNICSRTSKTRKWAVISIRFHRFGSCNWWWWSRQCVIQCLGCRHCQQKLNKCWLSATCNPLYLIYILYHVTCVLTHILRIVIGTWFCMVCAEAPRKTMRSPVSKGHTWSSSTNDCITSSRTGPQAKETAKRTWKQMFRHNSGPPPTCSNSYLWIYGNPVQSSGLKISRHPCMQKIGGCTGKKEKHMASGQL